MTVDGKQYIDSIKFEKFLATLPAKGSGKAIVEGDTTVNANALLKGKKIEILNAGGIDGLAKKVGDELVQKFGIVYSAENYTEQGSMNYVINHTLSPGEVNQLIEGLNLKYIKVLDDPTVKPDADFVIITGDDANIEFPIEIMTTASEGNSKIATLLNGYKLQTKQTETYKEQKISDKKQIEIYYNPFDVYTAQKIAKILGNAKLIEDTAIQNKILIVSKN